MGTERWTEFEGPCLCGKGKDFIDGEAPDHPWAKSYSPHYKCRTTCEECRANYGFEERDGAFYRVLKTEITKKKKNESKWHEKQREIEEHVISGGYHSQLARRLNALRSMAAMHRVLAPLVYAGSLNSFRNDMKSAGSVGEWIERHVHGTDWSRLAEFLGIQDSALQQKTEQASKLWQESQKPLELLNPPFYSLRKD
jgi:hypothetical protein